MRYVAIHGDGRVISNSKIIILFSSETLANSSENPKTEFVM